MSTKPASVTELLRAYRAGDPAAGDRLLDRFAPWLRVQARRERESRLRGKVDPSDVAQQACLEVVKALRQFRGRTEAEFVAWLRQILSHTLAHEVRRYAGTRKREVAREVSFDQAGSRSSQRLADLLAATDTSPSQRAVGRERERELAAALERLPADYREVIRLRHWEGLSHEEVALRLGRNPGAVRMLWVRALARLREELAGTGSA